MIIRWISLSYVLPRYLFILEIRLWSNYKKVSSDWGAASGICLDDYLLTHLIRLGVALPECITKNNSALR